MTRRPQLQAFACLALALLGPGCGKSDEVGAPGRLPQRGPRAPLGVATEATAPPASPTVAATPLPGATALPTEQQEEDAPERDLGAELNTAVGSPASCLKPRLAQSAPTTIQVMLEAVVTENGIVTRGSASSAALDAAELECVRARVLATRLRGPVEGAPRTVTTSTTLTLKPPPGAQPSPSGTTSAAAAASPTQPTTPSAQPYPGIAPAGVVPTSVEPYPGVAPAAAPGSPTPTPYPGVAPANGQGTGAPEPYPGIAPATPPG